MTTETIKIMCGTPAAIVLLDAISSAAGDRDVLEVFNIPNNGGDDTQVSVEVRVNGVLVPFTTCLDAALDRWAEHNDQEVKDQAIQLITEAGLDTLYGEIRNAEWKIRAALSRVKP